MMLKRLMCLTKKLQVDIATVMLLVFYEDNTNCSLVYIFNACL